MNAVDPAPWTIYLAIAWFVAAWVLFARIMPAYWRRPDRRFAAVPTFWVWGAPLWRGFVRAFPTLFIGLGLVIFMPSYMAIVGPPNVRADVFWSWFVLFMLTLCAWASVALFNRPRILVPPYLRSELGAVGEWRRARVASGKARKAS